MIVAILGNVLILVKLATAQNTVSGSSNSSNGPSYGVYGLKFVWSRAGGDASTNSPILSNAVFMTTVNYKNNPPPISQTTPSSDAVAPNQLSAGRSTTPAIRPNELRAARPALDNKGKPARFQEGKSTDLILEYYRDDTIYMKRPEAHDGDFLTIFNSQTIASEIRQRVTGREVAVVVLGYIYSDQQQQALYREWQAIAKNCGFKRLVFLRGAKYKSIDGLPILFDSAMDVSNESANAVTQSQSRPASVPSAP